MQKGPTPVREISPTNLLNITCVSNIQQTANSTNSSSGSNSSNITTNSKLNIQKLNSINTRGDIDLVNSNTNSNNTTNNNTTTASDHLESRPLDSSEQRNSRTKGNHSSSLLLITHIVEIAAMILATFLRFIPFEAKNLNSTQNSYSKSSFPYESADKDELSSFLLVIHTCILILPLMIVTAISLHWVHQVQDFSGKVVARLVCWVLHFLQSSLVWRYLKLQIAYDPGDLAELGMLRFIQLHVHSLPFLVMHLAITLSYPRSLGLALSLVFALFFSIVTTIVVSTLVRQQISPPNLIQMCHFTITETNANSSFKIDNTKCHIVVSATKMCALWSRIVSMAALFCLHAIWAIGLIAIHWLFAVIWLGFQKELTSSVLNSSRQIIRKGFEGFLLLWDWQLLGNNEQSPGLCSRPQLPIIYYTIVATQNIAATCAWYITARFHGISLLYTIVLISVIISQVIALLLLSLSYMYFSSYLFRLSPQKSSISQKTSLLVTPIGKISLDLTPKLNSRSDNDSVVESPIYVNFGKLVEETGILKSNADSQKFIFESKISKKVDPSKQKETSKEIKYPSSLTPRLLSNHLHSSMFSYANDILHQTSKSEQSSTENGSFNSRNTNTLNTHGTIIPDFDTNHRPHGSFSDSFSSLSCGTVNKAITSFPKRNVAKHFPSYHLKRLKQRKSCQGKCYQGKTLGRVSHKCAGLKEEQDEAINEDALDDQNSCSLVEKGTSPPHVAVVRATQRFQVVCTKCLNAHDPLLTQCRNSLSLNGPPSLSYSCVGELGGTGRSSSTDYPSDTELTTTIDSLSSLSAESHSTYTTWPVGKGPGLAKLLMREKGGYDYVTAWLRHQQTRTSDIQKPTHRLRAVNPNRKISSKCYRHPRKNGQRIRLRALPSFIQDLETVV